MDKITVIFTTRKWNPISWLIRWSIPRSRFYLAEASHCMILDGDSIIEAHMLHGVRRVPVVEGLRGCIEVARVNYHVPDAQTGIEWARSQIGKKYDWLGAFGLALAPDRNWLDESKWFCFEFIAAAIEHAGRKIFSDVGHVSGSELLMINP